MSNITSTLLALYGLLHLGAAVVGSTNLMDYHLYFGPSATAWHAKNAPSCKP